MQLASEALNILNFDETWIIPCGERTDKWNQQSPAVRMEMVRRSVNDFFPKGYPVKIDDIELKNG